MVISITLLRVRTSTLIPGFRQRKKTTMAPLLGVSAYLFITITLLLLLLVLLLLLLLLPYYEFAPPP